MLVCQRFHNGADGQAVEIVVNKDQDAQGGGCQLCHVAVFDLIG